jgi:hypothetical protein
MSIDFCVFLNFFIPQLPKISYNVLAVYEGFYGAIKETEGFQRHKNFGWSEPWEWSVAE